MKITLNLENKGLDCIFKPYQKRIMEYLWSQDEPRGSAKVWEGIGTDTISRASVINSLKWLADVGILSRDTTTGKGGHRGLYTAMLTEQEILNMVHAAATKALNPEEHP